MHCSPAHAIWQYDEQAQQADAPHCRSFRDVGLTLARQLGSHMHLAVSNLAALPSGSIGSFWPLSRR